MKERDKILLAYGPVLILQQDDDKDDEDSRVNPDYVLSNEENKAAKVAHVEETEKSNDGNESEGEKPAVNNDKKETALDEENIDEDYKPVNKKAVIAKPVAANVSEDSSDKEEGKMIQQVVRMPSVMQTAQFYMLEADHATRALGHATRTPTTVHATRAPGHASVQMQSW